MRTSDFDYKLPPELIAQIPAVPRDHSRLMVLHRNSGEIQHLKFCQLPQILSDNDVLVFNDTRVLPAQLEGRRQSGGKVEFLLLRRIEINTWEALVKPARRVKPGEKLEIVGAGFKPAPTGKSARWLEMVERKEEGLWVVRLSSAGVTKDEMDIEGLGQTPLPPYIHTPLEDPERYQTVYAREVGSVAAPTAGLHFTPELLRRLEEGGIDSVFITLHVGLDTFRPIRVENPHDHPIFREYGEISPEAASTLTNARRGGKRITCVGTTSVRLLEGAASLQNTVDGIEPLSGWIDLLILPGYHFCYTDALITNFHLPRTTLLMLVSAFAGRELTLHAYNEAIRYHYRFYSFGDAMLIF